MSAAPPVAPRAANPGPALGIVGLILAILFPLQLFGLIVSLVARRQSKKAGLTNGFATAGIIVSIVVMVVTIIVAALVGPLILSLLQTCAALGQGTHIIDGVTYTC